MTAPTPTTWPTTRLCPATSNLPTRMLASTWQALCAAMQRREAVGASRGKGGMAPEDFKAISAARFPCATCQGRTLPPGLELITQEEAEQMARTTKRGTCELCGVHANVGMNHGSAACPACTHVQTALNKRPEAVAKAIRAMHKTEEMLGHLIPAGGLAVKVTADLLQEISGIVGYDGEDPAELVEAVRKRALACVSCDAEDVLHEIREIVGYSPDQGDKGLAEAVRALTAASGKDCTDEEIRLRDDLARACDMGQDYSHRWGSVAQGAIQEIARLTNRKDFWIEAATELKAKVVELNELIGIGEAKLILAEQSRDEWEQRAVQAESNVETLESELRERSQDCCALDVDDYERLLTLALAALRCHYIDHEPIADEIEKARREI